MADCVYMKTGESTLTGEKDVNRPYIRIYGHDTQKTVYI